MPKTLLLADDSVTIQKVVGITFANEDVELITVDNGDDALVRAREAKPDLVLADVAMPGLSGYELCGAIKRDRDLCEIPVLLLTGTFESYDPERAEEVRADAHISKPFEAQALIDQVNSLLAEAEARPALQASPAAEITTALSTSPSASPPSFSSPSFSSPSLGSPSAILPTGSSDDVVVPEPLESALPKDDIAFTPADFAAPQPPGDQTTVLDETALRALERPPEPRPVHRATERPAAVDQVESAVAAELADLTDDTSGTTSGFLDPLAVGEAERSLEAPEAPPTQAPASSLAESSFTDPLGDPAGSNPGAIADADAALLEDSFSDLPPAARAEPVPSWDPDPPTDPSDGIDPLGETARAEAADPGAEADADEVADEDLPWVEPMPLEDELLEPEVTATRDDVAPESALDEPIEPARFEEPEPSPLPEPSPDLDRAPVVLAPTPEPVPQPAALPPTASPLDSRALAESVEKVAWEAFGNLSEQIVRDVMRKVEEVCWEVIPQLAERIIREEIEHLKSDGDSS